jgi:hypothetical protein
MGLLGAVSSFTAEEIGFAVLLLGLSVYIVEKSNNFQSKP